MVESNLLFAPANYQNRSSSFFDTYNFEKIIMCPEKKIQGLASKPQRVCRFCNLKYGEVYFKGEAHVISKLLGNKFLVSDFECDNCNAIFSTYESHLSHFIGPIRAFQKLNGLDEKYKFKSPDKKTVTENFNLYGLENSFAVSREDIEDQTFEFNRETGETIIKFIKHSYSPLLVYKSILKMALSCLEKKDTQAYDLAFRYILSNTLDDKIKGIAKILIYSTPPGTGYKNPFAALYKKKDEIAKTSTHIFVLYFMNQIYQIVIPLNIKDLKFYTNEIMDILYCPPLFTDVITANTIQIKEQYLDMSSMEIVKSEEEIFILKYNKNDYANAKVYDPKTNEIKDGGFDSNSIKKIVFVPKDSNIKF
jgi:hypothetical protein